MRVAVQGELGLALEDEEAVGVTAVRVRVDALEVRAEPQLDHLERVELTEDAVMPRLPLHVLAVVGPVRDPTHGPSRRRR